MAKIKHRDIEWPWWCNPSWCGIWTGAAIGVVVLSMDGQDRSDAIEALKARPACQCVIQERCDFTDVAPAQGTGADDGRVEWERWERVDGRASK